LELFLKVEIILDKRYKKGLMTLQTETLLTQMHCRQKKWWGRDHLRFN